MNEYNSEDINYQQEIAQAAAAADQTLYYLNEAQRYLSSAGGWGVVDLLGGGFISTLAKHSKLDNANRALLNAKTSVLNLKKELQDVNMISSIDIDAGDFLTFADYFFDGFVADWLVQSKIRDAQVQVDSAIIQVTNIRNRLNALL